jgi:hypothetical protein
MGGAIGDSSWIDPGQPPLISFHVPTDPFAPYVEGTVLVPVVNFPVVEVQGSYLAQKLVDEYGNNDVFANEDWIDPYTEVANSRNDGYDGLFPMLPTDPTNNAPWQFWAWNNVNADAPADSVYARLVIDSVMNYVAPRACLALGLGCDLSGYITAVEEILDADAVGLQVAPNPASDVVRFETNAQYPMESIYVFDMSGKLVKAHVDIENTQFTMQRNSLGAGMYLAKVVTKEGSVMQKVIFR